MHHPKLYKVRKSGAVAGPSIDLNSLSWREEDELTDFIYPWENGIPAPPLKFSAMYDEKWFYWLFDVEDENVKIYVDKNKKEEVVHGDRVEIFFSTDAELSSYYCLEVDPLGRVFDYHARYYRNFDPTWEWPSGELRVHARQSEHGYSVAGMLSIDSLKKLGLLKNDTLMCGLYRGKCIEVDLKKPNMKWISWADPATVTPDFHLPSSFGTFQLKR